jgi:EAL domain-containing protein (putative c-di-GMP-specific phosphodiesterase class I)
LGREFALGILVYLRQFSVDCLKIDRMFNNAITPRPNSKTLVSTPIQLGDDLGPSTWSQMQTADKMDLRRGANVDQAQGFLIGRPFDAEPRHQVSRATRPTASFAIRT